MKPARLRPQAREDLVDLAHHDRGEGGRALAGRFFDAAVACLAEVERMPGIGSPRIGDLCDLPGLRAWPVPQLPARWFYLERGDHLDVVRLLGSNRDLVAILGE